MNRVTYLKTFVGGMLNGLTYNASVRCPNRKSAEQFAQKLQTKKVIKPCAGSQRYTVSDVKVE